MKKSLIFALAAGAFLASCSSDDDVNVGNVVDDGSKVAIKLGFATGDITTRAGVGTVGGVEAADNVWSKQLVNVLMFDRGTLDFATEELGGTTKLFDETTGQMVTNSAAANVNYGEAKDFGNVVKYYPVNGTYSFFAYFNGGLGNNGSAISNQAVSGDNYVANLAVDGSQDVMIAKARYAPTAAKEGKISNDGDLTSEEAALYSEGVSNAYSSFAARRGVQPVLTFKHLLSRLNFKVIAADAETAANLAIDSIMVFAPKTGTITLAWKDATKDALDTDYDYITWTASEITALPKNRAETQTADHANALNLMQRPTAATQNETLIPLMPVKSQNDLAAHPEFASDATKYTQVGEALLVAPGKGFVTDDADPGKYMMVIKAKEYRKNGAGKVYTIEDGTLKAYYWKKVTTAAAAGNGVSHDVTKDVDGNNLLLDGTDGDKAKAEAKAIAEAKAADATKEYEIDPNHATALDDATTPTKYVVYVRTKAVEEVAVYHYFWAADDAAAKTKAQNDDNQFDATTAGADPTTNGYAFDVIAVNGAGYKDGSYKKMVEGADITDNYSTQDITYIATIITPETDKKFHPGSTYNVLLQLTGSTEIKVYTELTAWVAGDNIVVNPMNEDFNFTPAAAEFNVSKNAVTLTYNAASQPSEDITLTNPAGATSIKTAPDNTIATASLNGNTLTITAVGKGETSVIVTDGTTEKTISITINPAAATLASLASLDNDNVTGDTYVIQLTDELIGASQGVLTASSSDTNVATVGAYNQTNKTFTVNKVANGSVTITINQAAAGNYAAGSQTVSVEFK